MWKKLLQAWCAATVVFACGVPCALGQEAYEPSVALVAVAEGASPEDVRSELEATAGVAAAEVSAEAITSGVVRVELEAGVSVEEAVSELLSTDVVADAQPNYCYQVMDEDASTLLEAMSVQVNDAKVGEQWALGSMGVFDAWSYKQVNGAVTVALLDLGCNVSHEDLKSNIVATYNAHNAVHGGNTSDVTPLASNKDHGTHVAGIISAVSNNGIGVSGISYNARLLPIKVVDAAGMAYTDDLVKAYDYILSQASAYNIRVINISMGTAGSIGTDDAFLKKIDQAYARGIVTVAASGNANGNLSVPYDCYPGDYDKVVSVINLQQSGSGVSRAEKSNYNRSGERDKNISAPGSNIYGTYQTGYGVKSGTSMAAPHVSAVLALEFAANPSLSAADAVNILYQTATDIGASGWDDAYGWGEVNALAAVRRASGASGGGMAMPESVQPQPSPGTSQQLPVRTCPCYTMAAR